MAKNTRVKTFEKNQMSHDDLAVRIKKMLDDIIDVAFKDSSAKMILQFKRFTVFCSEEKLQSRLGDCWYNKDGSSSIRILYLGSQKYQDTLICAIHEVSHHVEHSLHGSSGHGPEFYRIHKILLYAAFDMGILAVDDVLKSEFAGNSHKLAKMMNDYVPHPVDYKKDLENIIVYNAAGKDLKPRGYIWNSLDLAWTKEIHKSDLESEKQYLLLLGVKASDIKCADGAAVVLRLRKSVKLYNVPYQYNLTIEKFFKYQRVNTGSERFWKKQINGVALPAKEQQELTKLIPNIRIVIE